LASYSEFALRRTDWTTTCQGRRLPPINGLARLYLTQSTLAGEGSLRRKSCHPRPVAQSLRATGRASGNPTDVGPRLRGDDDVCNFQRSGWATGPWALRVTVLKNVSCEESESEQGGNHWMAPHTGGGKFGRNSFSCTPARLRRHFGHTRMMLATRTPFTRCTCQPASIASSTAGNLRSQCQQRPRPVEQMRRARHGRQGQ